MRTSKTMAYTCIAIILLFVLSSCDKIPFQKDFTPEKEFTLTMSAVKDKKNFSADITCLSYADIKISFTYPEELSGFSITANEDGYDINAFGVPDVLQNDEINDASLLNVLIGSIRKALFSNHEGFVATDTGFMAEISVDSVPVSVYFSEEGFITKITAPTIDFSADFTKQG